MIRLSMVTALVLLLTACHRDPGALPERQEEHSWALRRGGGLYAKVCANCHGPSGRGDGLARRQDLKKSPPDLTGSSDRAVTDWRLGRLLHCPDWRGTLTGPELDALRAHLANLKERKKR